MAKKKTSGASFRNGDLFCYNCGRGYKMNLPQPVSMASAMMIQFDKDHRNCEKTWEPPVVDQSLSEIEKATWWMTGYNGERGESSKAIWNRLFYTDGKVNLDGQSKSHPCDPDDFRRCYLLLETVPEWKSRLSELKDLSPVWSNLVDNWDKLTYMLQEQMGTGEPNGMYEFMKTLGC